MIYPGSWRRPIFKNISNKAAYGTPEGSFGRKVEGSGPSLCHRSPRKARPLLSLLIYGHTRLQMGYSLWAFSREVGRRRAGLGQPHRERTCWAIRFMGSHGSESKRKRATAAHAVHYVCAHSVMCPRHTHMCPSGVLRKDTRVQGVEPVAVIPLGHSSQTVARLSVR